jgi:MinD-like ATPase involved in chromosome partitioning or flagellar assembly
VPFITEHFDSPATKAFQEIVQKIEHFLEEKKLLESTLKPGLRERGTRK